MYNTRKWAFMLSALVVAGIGLSGCEEDKFEQYGNQTTISNDGSIVTINSDYKFMSQYKQSDLASADGACKKAGCSSSSACKTGADYVACLCVTNMDDNNSACHTYGICKGIGDCKPECGSTADSCGWSVCKDAEECKPESVLGKLKSNSHSKSLIECKSDTACTELLALCTSLAALNPDADFDGDSLTNDEEHRRGVKESKAGGPHPCFADTDGDGIGDSSDENPDVSDDVDPNEAVLKTTFCNLVEGNGGQFKDMTIALLKDSTYYPKEDLQGSYTIFSNPSKKVVGFFGSGQSKNGGQLLKAAKLTDGTYVEESNFTSSAPLADWGTKGYLGIQNPKDYQIVPNSEILRLKYAITLEANETLESVATKIGTVFGASSSSVTSSTTCASNKASLYLARNTYEDGNTKFRIYSGALACSDNVDKVSNIMDDVLSGTLVAPKNIASVTNNNGFVPYKKYLCQTSKIGDATGAVDFIWVLDNSGSMSDELDNISKTVDIFAGKLKDSGIDYRLAVTTTDAYIIDETSIVDKATNDASLKYRQVRTSDNNPIADKYFNALGVRTPMVYQSIVFPGFIPAGNTAISYFKQAVNQDMTCDKNGTKQKNICGHGFEDGFRSGVLALSRLAIDVSGDEAKANASKELQSDYDKEHFEELVQLKTSIMNGEYVDINNREVKYATSKESALTLRDDALKYFIWVTDEESRQFKELREIQSNGCLTGYALSNGKMASGPLPDNADPNDVCNVSIKDKLEAEINSNISKVADDPNSVLLQDMSQDELKANANLNDYNAMLEYYIGEYRKFAGSGGIAGFALVGDIGNQNGGACKTLKVCTGTCYADGKDTVGKQATKESGCFKCDGTWDDDPRAIVGANYGLSYIHLARFLSTVDEGKEGGFASICSTSYETTIKSIFDDVSGRVASHTLQGYPISSTIRVAVMKAGGQVVELTRGASSRGFSYDASQNAVVFTGISDLNLDKDDWFAISYDMWSLNEG